MLLPKLFAALQADMRTRLGIAEVFTHPDAKGDQAELNWFNLLDSHLPRRYLVLPKATVVDHRGEVSQEIDLLIVDRQYSPFVFHADARTYVPAESVYAVLECKQGLDRENLLYAANKVASVRALQRTTAPVVHAGGTFEPRAPFPIMGGILTTRMDWVSGFGDPFRVALGDQHAGGRLDIGCCADSGGWTAEYAQPSPKISVSDAADAVMYFMLTLFEQLQARGTVTAMDYGKWKSWIRLVEDEGGEGPT